VGFVVDDVQCPPEGYGVTKLHLDTDLGGDMDDLCALALALAWPDAGLVGVTTTADDRGRRAGYTRYALRVAGRDDVPVAAGADVTLGCYRVELGYSPEALYWPEPIRPAPGPHDDALDLLERSIAQGAIIAAIGPFTNLALLERRSPGILREAHLYCMGGYVFPPRPGFPQWGRDMDWNNQVDVASAHFVLSRTDPLLVPLTVTVETALRRADLPALRQAGPLPRLIARQAEAFAAEYDNEARWGRTCAGLPDDTINFQHDPLAVAIALGWRDGVHIDTLPLKTEVRDGRLHQSVDSDGRPTRIVTRIDGDRFNRCWLDTVVRL
jgi:inosine-uridine nucleoside N-ribohydrolase